MPLPGNALCSTLSTQREPAQPCLVLAMGHPALPLPGGSNALRCTSSTQREPSHALRCSWGTQHCPCLVAAMPCPAPPVPCMSPAMPCAAHGATQLQMAWHVGSPNFLWGHPTPPAATGMGPQMLMLVAWLGTGAPQWCWWLALHPAASGMGPPNSKRCGVTQLFVGPVPPNSPSCHWHRATNAYAGGLALVHHYCAST